MKSPLLISAAATLALVAQGSSAASTCPPNPASSMEEVDYYCPGAVSFFGHDEDRDNQRSATSYECYDDSNAVSCTGTLDDTIIPPPCSQDLSSCSEDEFETVCRGQPSIFSFCSGYFDDDTPIFRCWDKTDNQWCQGTIKPSKGSFHDPVCPTTSLSACEDLEEYGIRHTQCICSVDGEYGKFECMDEDGETAWCSGTIGGPAPVAPSRDSNSSHKKSLFSPKNQEQKNLRIAVLLLMSMGVLLGLYYGVQNWRQRRFRRQAQRLRQEELQRSGGKTESDGIGYSDDVEMTGDQESPTTLHFERQGQWYW